MFASTVGLHGIIALHLRALHGHWRMKQDIIWEVRQLTNCSRN